MKHTVKRLFLLMTVVMLLSMASTAFAQVIWCPDMGWEHKWGPVEPLDGSCWGVQFCTVCGAGNEVPLNHNWQTVVTEQPSCIEPGRRETICSNCGDEKGDPEEIPALGHNWGSWYWAHGEQANCMNGAWQVRDCSRCGRQEDRWVGLTDHSWSHWATSIYATCDDEGEESRYCYNCGKEETRSLPSIGHSWSSWKPSRSASCTSEGEEYCYCYNCFKEETRSTPKLDHEWGDWETIEEPTCTQEGRERRDCVNCSRYTTSSLAKVDHVFGEWYVVTEPQVGLPGLEERACTFECGTVEQRNTPALEQDFGDDDPVSADGLELTLVLSSTPANGTHFVVGEEVVFTETWANNTGKELYPFYVSIWTYLTPEYAGVPDIMCSWDAEETGPVAPGATGSHQLVTTVTEADVARGAIYAMSIILSSDYASGAALEDVTTPFVTAPCGEGESAIEGLTVTKTASAGDYSDPCKPGDEVTFTITVTNNTGVELLDVEITDPIKGSNEDSIVDIIPSMQPGESVTASFSYTVTEEDATVGVEGFENTAYASGHTADGTKVSGTSNTVFVWCVIPHEIMITKSVANAPENGEFFVPGETIVFEISMRDDTPYPLYNITLTDPLCEDQYTYDEINDMSYLFFGELYREGNPMGESSSATVTVNYVVTEADAEAGSVTNTAEVSYQTWYGKELSASASATAPCGVKEAVYTTAIDLELVELPVAENVKPGDVLTVKLNVTNTGETTVTLNSSRRVDANGEWFDAAGTMIWNKYQDEPLGSWFPAGASLTSDLDITVTESSIAAGEIRFTYTQDARPFYAFVDGVITDIPAHIVPTPEGTTSWRVKEEEKASDSVEIVISLTDGTGNPDVDGDGIPDDEDPDNQTSRGLTVDMTYTNTPTNGSFFTPGEVIDYLITVTNTGDVTLTNLYVGNSSSEAVLPAPSEIAPGQTVQVRYYKMVYEEHAKAGGIDSYGHAQGNDGDPFQPESLVSGRSDDVFVPCGMGDSVPEVYYLKTVANAPANGLYFTEGETIKYRLSFGNNIDKVIYNITLNDPMADANSVAFAGRLEAGEFLMGEFEYVVTASDVDAGQIVNTATSTWATKEEGTLTTTPSNTVVTPTTGTMVPGNTSADAQLEKYVKNTPANGEFFVPGETIEYAVVFMNVCQHELHDVEIMDPLKGSNEDSVLTREPVVAPLSALHFSFTYVVTEEDAARGYVENTASSFWLNPEIEEWSSCDSNTVVTPTGMPAAPIQVTKAVANTPANGEYFVIGETIEFSITVTNNTGYELAGMIITDALDVDWICEPNELLLPGESRTVTFSYVVTELDAAAGSVANYATVRIIEADGYHFFISNVATAPCWYYNVSSLDNVPEYPIFSGTIVDTPFGIITGTIVDTPFGIITGLEVTKEVESLPLNGSYYTEGETVAYKITYTNSGEMPLTDVMIYDALVGMSEIATAETLNPGESRVCWPNHTVTADDVARGYISNTAIGQFELNGYVNTVSSNTVVVDTDGQPDQAFSEGILPSGGTIDTEALRSGEDYCVRAIMGRDNVSVSYETSFCSVHAATLASVRMIQSAANSPAMQMQAAAYAVALWRAEVEKSYQAIIEAADSQAKAVVMTEYIRFLADMANYEAMLKQIYLDKPVVVAQKMAALWEDKCTTLCYEIHAEASARKDSLLSIAATSGASADECASITVAPENGKSALKQTFCPTHGFPFAMTDMMLNGEDNAQIWLNVRQIWNVELTSAYNKLAAKLGANSALALAEYNTLSQWMQAREAFLIALYSNNPELVAQTMVKTIMERVNDLCQLTK